MAETVHFRPEAIAWWSALLGIAPRLGRCHRWEARDHGPADAGDGAEQHPTDTLVLCLAGAARIEHGRRRCDLAPGDALVLRPGAWHRHAPLRRGALLYRQGAIAGRSDFFLEDHRLRIVAAWPEHPARGLLAAIGAAADEAERRGRLADLLGHLAREAVEPLPATHPACLPMEYALFEHLHRADAVARIVRASGLSRAQAYRVFRSRWGAGIAAAVRGERVELGRALLADGIPPAEVAARCGMPGRGTFARALARRPLTR
jgi:AraC-like DNA-binding protein